MLRIVALTQFRGIHGGIARGRDTVNRAVLLQTRCKCQRSREEDAMRRIQEVVDLITGARCFASALAQHFGITKYYQPLQSPLTTST